MRKTRQQGISVLAMVPCVALALGVAHATQPTKDDVSNGSDFVTMASLRSAPDAAPRVASRDMAERYYQAYRLIGSAVLNLDGARIGEVDNLILNDRGEIRQMLVALTDTKDADGGAIAISPHRAEIVSTDGARVTVIRVDLSREEIIHAQFSQLKSNARAPAQRGAGSPELHRSYGPLY